MPTYAGQEVKAGALQFAVERLVDFVKQKENLDIDSATFRPSPDQWHRFLSLYYVFVQYATEFARVS